MSAFDGDPNHTARETQGKERAEQTTAAQAGIMAIKAGLRHTASRVQEAHKLGIPEARATVAGTIHRPQLKSRAMKPTFNPVPHVL